MLATSGLMASAGRPAPGREALAGVERAFGAIRVFGLIAAKALCRLKARLSREGFYLEGDERSLRNPAVQTLWGSYAAPALAFPCSGRNVARDAATAASRPSGARVKAGG